MTLTDTTVAGRRGFGKLVAAATISNVGDGVFLVAVPLLAADLTRGRSVDAVRATLSDGATPPRE
jgi:hypothetical protein